MAVAYVLQPRVTVEFQEEPSADMLDAISVRLWRYQARSLHLAVSWLPQNGTILGTCRSLQKR